MVYRVLNSKNDPQRRIRALRLPCDLQLSLQICLERIWSADTITVLSHAHGRAIGTATGLGLVDAITHTQFMLLGEAFAQAFQDCLASLTEPKLTAASHH